MEKISYFLIYNLKCERYHLQIIGYCLKYFELFYSIVCNSLKCIKNIILKIVYIGAKFFGCLYLYIKYNLNKIKNKNKDNSEVIEKVVFFLF